MSSTDIGIDLGTTNSVVAYKDTTVKVIQTGANNEDLCRSCVALDKNNQFLVGNSVYKSWKRYTPHIVTSVKRLMGMNSAEFYTLTLEFSDGRLATINGYTHGLPFILNVAFHNGENRVVEAKENFFIPFIKELVRFYKEGTIPVSQEETLRIIAARGAAVEALKNPGMWINI